MSTNAARRLLYMLQICNASFPTGAFNHSYGFETWIDSEQINDAPSFEIACRDWLIYGVAGADGAAVAHAHRAMRAGDIDALVALDDMAGALKLSREAREASDKTGHALLSALRDVFEPKQLKQFENAIRSGRCAGHQAVIFGAAAGEFGLPEKDTVLSFLQAAVSNLAGVASRIIPLGQVETQRIILNAWPLLLQATEQARDTALDEMGSSMTSLDIASMRHERLHTRLCMS
ncbi:MAG: urease accessory UreF family protein [Alphaproteobacteria bacterium]|nr:urease accessory UreF family protein [Alphaproteobacteria bacterium]